MPEFFKTRTKVGKYLYLFLFIPSKKLREFLRHQLDLFGLKSKYAFFVCDHCNSFVRDFFLEIGALLPETAVYESLYKRQRIMQRRFSRDLEADARYNLTAGFIASWLPKSARLGLDVGCAEGYLSAVMKKNHNINLLGIDPSRSMIASAREIHGLPENYRQGDYVRSVFEEGSFDFIVCTHVIEHLMDPTDAIDNFYYHLKKSDAGSGGLLFLSTPSSNLLSWEKVNQSFNDNFKPGHLWIASLEGLTQKVISAGFKLIYSELNPSGSLSASGEKPQGMTLVFTTNSNNSER
jgi:SAM-dependent methyltransferase